MFWLATATGHTNKSTGDIKMKNRRKRILLTFLSGIVLLMAAGISRSYAQGDPLDFAGNWQTILIMNGKRDFPITIVQNGDQATGSFAGNGKIEGTVSGRVFRFKWQSDGGTGSGRFVMDEKQRVFNGTYNRGSNPDDVDGTWSGNRLVSPEWRPGHKDPADKEPMPIPNKRSEGAPDPMGRMSEAEYLKKLAEYEERQKNAPATFAGVWSAKSGEKLQFPELLLQQTDKQVVGRLYASNPDLGVIKDGIIDRNTLHFTVWRPQPFTGRYMPDIYMGTGEFVMDADGKSFRGTILSAAASGTLIAR